ncbi:hypothetical protein [Pseudonocardia sp. GCM10023141]|uniref:hypothetical protein n=1 Tax=Pseudonocardia sp. GCM10023141 TaxID=3252653 RepID=UPI00361B5FB7
MSRSRMPRHVLAATALVPLALALTAGCGAATTAGNPLAAGGASSAAAPTTSPNAAFCSAIAQLGVQTKQITSKPKLAAIDFLNVADAYDKVAAVAPPELKAGLATVSRDYRMVGRGDVVLAKVSPEIEKNIKDLTAATTQICVAK